MKTESITKRTYEKPALGTAGLTTTMRRAAITLLLAVMTTATVWALSDANGTFSTGVQWAYTDANHTLTLTYSGEGTANIPDAYSSANKPWQDKISGIQHIVIGSGINNVGEYVFKSHTALQDVTIEGTTLTTIKQYAFYNCPNLTSVTLPSSLTTIGDWAFATSGLTSVTLPEGLTFIGQKAFYATALTSLTIPSSVTTIRYEAFRHCNSLSMVIMNVADPSTLTLESAFPLYMTVHVNDVAAWEAQFPYATYFCVFEDIPTNIWESGNTHVKLFADGTVRVSKKAGTDGVMANYASETDRPWRGNKDDIKKVIVKSGVTSIGNNAFFQCSNLTSITLPEGVSSIGDYAFRQCSNLTSVTLPEGLTSIGIRAFNGCSSFISVVIPATVTTIKTNAFYSCTSLASVTIYAPSLTEYGVQAFTNNANGRKIYVFSDCVNTYKSQNNWKEYATVIVPITLTSNDAGGELGSWCTYYNGLADVTVAEGTTVYTAKQNNAGGVTLTETGSRVIKRGEAVLLKSAANIVLSSAADSGTGTYTGNELKGVDCETAQDANTTYYVLSKVNGIFGFYKLKNTVKLGANKAYLAVATPPSLAPAYFGFDEGTTNILNTDFTDSTDKVGAWYTLDGRKLQGMPTQKGLYIVNGKKIVIK